MKNGICVSFALAAIFAVSYAAPQCDDFNLAICGALIGEGFDVNDPKVAEDEFELDARCRAIAPFMECIAKEINRCPPKDMTKEYVNFVKEQNEVEEQICNSGNELRERVLVQSKCLNQQLDELERECGNAIEVHADILTTKNCDAHFKYRQCYIDITTKNCGTEALKVVRDVALPMLNFFDSMCKKQ